MSKWSASSAYAPTSTWSPALFVTVLLTSCAPRAVIHAERTGPSEVPTIPVRAMDRSETSLAAALGGKPALVSLWATWCDACRDEMPALVRLDAWARAHGALVVGVAVGEPIDQVSRFATEKRMPYPVFVDEDFRLADALGEKRVPTTLVVDRFGRVVYSGGAVDERSMAALKKAAAAND